ncbi:MAG TPA: ABC transporter ATP-binding protein [Dongiaceae bacterium]|nr:ABC transporter ATP-binding protein [Dongiaceae bacterium]
MATLNELVIDVRLKQFPAVGAAPPVVAIKGLEFTVSPGEFVCVLGPSGCGKTTLLNIIAGLDRDFTGKISLPVDARRRQPVIGYVFQKPRLLPWRTVLENINLAQTPEQQRSGIGDELLAAMGLTEFRHAYPERLSVGMTRRVALVRAFAIEPNLLLMDEPFVSLDEPTAERLRGLLLEIWGRRPTTVLFVSHDTREVVQLADRVVLLTPSPGAVRAIVPIGMSRAERADPARIEELRRSLLDNRLTIS